MTTPHTTDVAIVGGPAALAVGLSLNVVVLKRESTAGGIPSRATISGTACGT
jgi:hypothetical protein